MSAERGGGRRAGVEGGLRLPWDPDTRITEAVLFLDMGAPKDAYWQTRRGFVLSHPFFLP